MPEDEDTTKSLKHVLDEYQTYQTLIFEGNVRLAGRVACDFYNQYHTFTLNDIFDFALHGLLHATQHYNPQRGCRFSTYAVPVMENTISRMCSEEISDIGISSETLRLSNQIWKIYQQSLLNEHEARIEETMDVLNCTRGEVIRALRIINLLQRVMLVDDFPGSTSGDEERGYIIEPVNSDEEQILSEMIRNQIIRIIQDIVKENDTRDKNDEESRLTRKEYLVVADHFGLIDGIEYSDDEIAMKLGISRANVGAKRRSALTKLAENPQLKALWKGE